MSRLESLRIKAKLLQKSKKKAGKEIPLKEAYEIIATSAGYPSWRDMKAVVEQHGIFRPAKGSFPYWNNWYANYDEAKSHLKESGEFLLPFENQFLICGSDYVEALGIELDDPDLKELGNDWVAGKESEAFKRIVEKIQQK